MSNETSKPLFNAYVDGFNLYLGALIRRPQFKWLDLYSFCSSLRPDLQLNEIYYFTARVKQRFPVDTEPASQHSYLRALEDMGVKVVYGKFRKNVYRFRLAVQSRAELTTPALPKHFGLSQVAINRIFQLAHPRVPTALVEKLEEKGSDVNLASHLLRDAFHGVRYALVVSGDTDLLTPVRFAIEAGMSVRVVIPNEKQSVSDFRRIASSTIQLRHSSFIGHSLPSVYITKKGGNIVRPAAWT